MNVFVTGPDGVLGSNLLRELLSRQYKVSVMVETGKSSPTIESLPIEIISGNLLNLPDLIQATKGVDIVIHCGANTSVFPARSEIVNAVNIEGTENIINACKFNHIKRLIYVGTANSFGSGTLVNPGDENKPFTAEKYGLDYIDSKFVAQKMVMDAVKYDSLDAVIVNPTFMIGPYDSGPSSGAMILGIYNKKIPGYTKGGKNYIAVKDVAIGITNAITLAKKGECYILGNENLSFKDVFKKISKIVGVKPPRIMLSKRLVVAFGWISSLSGKLFRYKPTLTYELAILSNEEHYYSPLKARKELDLPQTPIEDAIKDCFDWFGENGYLNVKYEVEKE